MAHGKNELDAPVVEPPYSEHIKMEGCLHSNSIFLAPQDFMRPVDPAFPLPNCSSEDPQSKLISMQILTPQLYLCLVSYFPLEIKTINKKMFSLHLVMYLPGLYRVRFFMILTTFFNRTEF